jgi:glycine/sarcosine N-methyltransferase
VDCSFGIGTQAIGLARRGYRVLGTDISERSGERARVEASWLGASVAFGVADLRDLGSVAGDFDLVISSDNAIPHLLDAADVRRALGAMRCKLRLGGMAIVSTRDYDAALVDRPTTAPPLIVAGPPRRLVVRLHEWDGPDSSFYTVRFFILAETEGRMDARATRHAVRGHHQRRADARRRGDGFEEVSWLGGEEVGFHQPLMTARNPT